jgi:glycosyltransferase involved in cell wall biosynthesis
MGEYPKVSFCIPAFNNSRFLSHCIESVLEQHYPNKEIIVVDDCSTDQTAKVLSKYADVSTVITNPFNHGQAVATSQAIHASTGEFCSILHSDDYLLPAFSELLPRLLLQHPTAGIAVGERTETDADNEVRPVAPFYDGNYLIPGPAQAEVFMFSSFLPCQVLARRDLLLQIGLLDPRYEVNLDGLTWFKCALKMDVAYICDAVSCYRRHAHSTTARLNQAPEHIAQIYSTLKEMHRLGSRNNLSTNRFQASEKRLAEIALKYTPEALASGSVDAALVYLKFARFFDDAITESTTYQALLHSITDNHTDPSRRSVEPAQTPVRRHSYPPPPGATRLP